METEYYWSRKLVERILEKKNDMILNKLLRYDFLFCAVELMLLAWMMVSIRYIPFLFENLSLGRKLLLVKIWFRYIANRKELCKGGET